MLYFTFLLYSSWLLTIKRQGSTDLAVYQGCGYGIQVRHSADPEVTVTGYTAPSTGQTVRAVLFDTFGTVVDWRSGISSAVRAFAAGRALTLDPEEFADAWRAQYQPSMERVRSGQRPYVSLDTLHSENLDTVLRSHDIDPGALAPGELTSLAAAWHYLPPWPDSVEGIRQIKRDFIVGPLSNGNTALLVDMAKAAGLAVGRDPRLGHQPRVQTEPGCLPETRRPARPGSGRSHAGRGAQQ